MHTDTQMGNMLRPSTLWHAVQKSRVAGQVTVLNDLLQPRQPDSGLVQSAPGSGAVELKVKEHSRLADYLTEMCGKPGERSSGTTSALEIRDLLKVRSVAPRACHDTQWPSPRLNWQASINTIELIATHHRVCFHVLECSGPQRWLLGRT